MNRPHGATGNSTFADDVADWAAADPGAIAIAGLDGTTHDYAAVLGRAHDLADRLRTATPEGSLVALDAHSALAGAVALLAGALARRAVLPLDRSLPPARLHTVLADARPAALLREHDGGALDVQDPPPEAGDPRTGLNRVAYVMYTSGSTGRPKGVAVPHTALRDRLYGLSAVPGLQAGESMLAMTSLSFDISLAELLLPLIAGGTVLAAPANARNDPVLLGKLLAERPATVLQATPSFWRLALAAGWQPTPDSRIWCGGEAMTTALAAALLPTCGELWNVYGPTEATIWASAARVLDAERLSLGQPLPGTTLWLADEEVLIYGDGLADGYLDRPDLTDRQFRIRDTPDGPRRCYHTGDRARPLTDGTLEFLGRLDDQVKLLGHRIELGDVEATFEAHPQVRQAVALLRDGDDPARAHIEVLITAGGAVQVRDLRAWAAARLPPAAVPRRITHVAELPRTQAGKVDRALLRATEAPERL